MATTTVVNLDTDEEIVYTIEPREAVIAAYAQSQGDWNTWDYEVNYGHLVKVHPRGEEAKRRKLRTWMLGSFAAVEKIKKGKKVTKKGSKSKNPPKRVHKEKAEGYLVRAKDALNLARTKPEARERFEFFLRAIARAAAAEAEARHVKDRASFDQARKIQKEATREITLFHFRNNPPSRGKTKRKNPSMREIMSKAMK